MSVSFLKTSEDVIDQIFMGILLYQTTSCPLMIKAQLRFLHRYHTIIWVIL